MSYTIGEVAKLIGESPHTLRYYAKEGLLPFGTRNENGVRIFEESDLQVFYAIKCLKKAKMPLQEIRQFVQYYLEGDGTIPQRLALFKKQRDAVAQELKDLQEVYENLTFRCWFFTEAEKAGTVQIKKNLDMLNIPEDMRPLVKKYGKSLALDHAAETGDGD